MESIIILYPLASGEVHINNWKLYPVLVIKEEMVQGGTINYF
jgi:hypothetical protein